MNSFNVCFDKRIANEIGIEEAIVLEYVYNWLEHNAAADINYYDGTYWTYNSAKAIQKEYLSFMNEKKVARLFKKLVDDGYLRSGNYNNTQFDRTLWYTFDKNAYSMFQKYGIHFSFLGNGYDKNDQPIPINNQYNNNIKKEEDKSSSKESGQLELFVSEEKTIKEQKKNNGKQATGKSQFDVREDLSYVSEEMLDIWNEWLDYKDEIKKQYKTQRGAKMQYTSLVNYSNGNVVLAMSIVKRSIEQSWDGLFSLSDKQKELFMSKNNPYMSNKEEYNAQNNNDSITEWQ